MAQTECDGHTNAQLESIASFMNLKARIPDMYHQEIGHLRDIFDIDLRGEFKNSAIWTPEAKDELDTFCSAVVHVLDEVRVKPKPYEPGSLEGIKLILVDMQKVMLLDVVDGVTECICKAPDICEQYEVPAQEAPLIHEEEQP